MLIAVAKNTHYLAKNVFITSFCHVFVHFSEVGRSFLVCDRKEVSMLVDFFQLSEGFLDQTFIKQVDIAFYMFIQKSEFGKFCPLLPFVVVGQYIIGQRISYAKVMSKTQEPFGM